MSATDKNPYEPPKAPLAIPPEKPATQSLKRNAYIVSAIGTFFLLVGAHFDDPHRGGATLSPTLLLVATAAHLGGGITLLIGLYRVYRAHRAW